MTRILFTGDWHVGSVFGLWLPTYRTKQGNAVELNPMQAAIYQYFREMCEELKADPPDYAVFLGDLIDGIQRRGTGGILVTNDLDDQSNCAVELAKMIPLKRKEYFGLSGTDYHEAQYNQNHYLITRALNGNDDYYWLDTMGYLLEKGFTINIAHGSSASFIYPEQVMAREKMFMLNAAELKKIDRPCDAVFRGHLHIYKLIEDSGFRLKEYQGLKSPAVTSLKTVICPSYQGQTDYMRKKSPFKLIPDIGYLVATVDDYGVHVRDRIFEHLGIKTVTREPDKRKRQT